MLLSRPRKLGTPRLEPEVRLEVEALLVAALSSISTWTVRMSPSLAAR